MSNEHNNNANQIVISFNFYPMKYYILFDIKYVGVLMKKTLHKQVLKWRLFQMQINFNTCYQNTLWNEHVLNRSIFSTPIK